ncbi:MAG: DUF3800 domain-containing protein [Eggerthellaceae bacterium]|nr:DUF3800 domain-containing protein [Eggerthellaceae bacterium]
MEYSVFIDEAGDTGTDSEYYMLTLVFHNQSTSLADNIAAYEARLTSASLSNVPFHMQPLMGGEGDYATLSIADRAKMLSYFHEFAVRCPVVHKTFVYEKKNYGMRGKSPDPSTIATRLCEQMEKDVKALLNGHLEFFQQFDKVKVYYDNGQKPVGKALRKSFADCLSSVAVEFKTDVRYRKYRLCQIADMFCGFALLDYKFSNGLQTDTDEMFADDHKNIRKRFLKKIGRLDADRCGFK